MTCLPNTQFVSCVVALSKTTPQKGSPADKSGEYAPGRRTGGCLLLQTRGRSAAGVRGPSCEGRRWREYLAVGMWRPVSLVIGFPTMPGVVGRAGGPSGRC